MEHTEVKLAKLETNVEYLVDAVKKMETTLETIGNRLNTVESLRVRVTAVEEMIIEERRSNKEAKDSFKVIKDDKIDVMWNERQIILSIIKWFGLSGIILVITSAFILAKANQII